MEKEWRSICILCTESVISFWSVAGIECNDHISVSVDVSMAESVDMAISDAIRHYSKPPSVVVNSAGITQDNFLLKMDETWFQKVIDVNLKVCYSFRCPFIQSAVWFKEIYRLSSIFCDINCILLS